MPAARWLDAFFEAYYARHPVNATFIGIHEHDHRLPDLSEHGLGDMLAEMRALLAAAPELRPVAPVPGGAHAQPQAVIDALDIELARGHLEIRIAELESSHFERGNPSVHASEAVFGVLSLLLTEHAPAAERLDRAIERMHGVPVLLEQAKSIRRAPVAWTERALRECAGALALFGGGVQAFAESADLRPAGLDAAADAAAAAFVEFERWLRSDVAESDAYACGDALLERYLRDGHRVAPDPDDVLGSARATLRETECLLEDRLHTLGLSGVDALNARLAERHASPDGYLRRFGEIADEMREIALARDWVTWPDAPLRFVERPEWVRDAAPHLYFLFYRSPAAFNRPAVHEHLVLPLDAKDTGPVLRATHDAMIRLNHVVHHAGLGHHVQNAHAFRSPSRIGRVAAVDCASRIALFCGGSMAEGWACYATHLMAESGALSELEQLSELQSTVRMCVRAIVDVQLHTDRISLDEAAQLYERQAGMPEPAARAEAVKNSMHPGVALMYLLGTQAILDLRRAASARAGEAFSLRGFHDDLLSWGSVPVASIAARLNAAAVRSDDAV